MMSGRVVWKDYEIAWLAKQVARSLIDQGFDALHAPPKEFKKRLMGPLRAAISKLTEDRRRDVSGPSQVDWLAPMVLDMIRGHQGLASSYPRDVLALHQGGEVVPFARIAEPEPDEEAEVEWPVPARPASALFVEECPIDRIELPEGFTVVPMGEWKRVRRALARQGRLLENLADQVAGLAEFLLDLAPHLAPAEEPGRGVVGEPDRAPIIAVAGLRGRDADYVEERVGEMAELVFIDNRHKRPRDVHDVDWLVATIHVGPGWIKQARELYAGKFSRVNDKNQVIKEIRRLVSGP